MSIDYLKIDDVPKSQSFITMGYVDIPSRDSWYDTCISEFLKQINSDYSLQDYKNFVQNNGATLNEIHGDKGTYVPILKFYGAYPTKELAMNRAREMAKTNKYENIIVQEAGSWIPYNPPDEMINDHDYCDKEMNKLMAQAIEHKKEAQKMQEEQKIALKTKNEKSQKIKEARRKEMKNLVNTQYITKRDLAIYQLAKNTQKTSEALMGDKNIISPAFKAHTSLVAGKMVGNSALVDINKKLLEAAKEDTPKSFIVKDSYSIDELYELSTKNK